MKFLNFCVTPGRRYQNQQILPVRTKKYQCGVKKTGPEVQTNSTFAEGLSSQMLRSISSDVVGDYGTDIQTGVEKESLMSAD